MNEKKPEIAIKIIQRNPYREEVVFKFDALGRAMTYFKLMCEMRADGTDFIMQVTYPGVEDEEESEVKNNG